MMMTEIFKHTTILKCKFNDSGYCKFGSQCRKQHFSKVCNKPNCKRDCKARHPKLCKHEQTCKFLKRGICAYKHVTLVSDDEKLKTLKNELIILKNKNSDQKNNLKEVEILLNKEKEKTIILEAEIKDLEIKSNIPIDMIDKLNRQIEEKDAIIHSILMKEGEYEFKKCPKCNELILSDHSLEDHILSTHSVGCNKCNKTFVSQPKLEKHMRYDHNSPDGNIFICKKCDFPFQQKSDYDSHFSGYQHNQLEKNNDSHDEDEDEEDFFSKCNYCGLIYNSYDEMDFHQSNYIICESCEVCLHNEFQFNQHEKCDKF